MVLLILAVIWAAVLIPPLLRAREEKTGPVESIIDFRRQLRVLQRSSPSVAVARETVPAGRRAGAVARMEAPPRSSPPAPRHSRAGAAGQGRSRSGSAPAMQSVGQSVGQSAPAYRPARTSDAAARARTMRRRRDVLFALLMGIGTTFVLAMVLGGAALWILHLAIDGLLVGYLALLVRLRTMAPEREMKLRFLPPPQPRAEPALLLRRSAN